MGTSVGISSLDSDDPAVTLKFGTVTVPSFVVNILTYHYDVHVGTLEQNRVRFESVS